MLTYGEQFQAVYVLVRHMREAYVMVIGYVNATYARLHFSDCLWQAPNGTESDQVVTSPKLQLHYHVLKARLYESC